MNLKLSLLATAAVLAVVASVPQTASAGSVCPDTTTGVTNCNLIITFNADGSITTSGPGGNYDGSEDALIGVINNTLAPITSFGISGPAIFTFDGDGIDTGYIAGLTGPSLGNPDTTNYGGPNGFFTILSTSSGIVNFANGGIAAGSSDYFSLEETIDLSAPPVVGGVPEPASLTIMGAALAGLAALRRRRNKA